ncbi:MAG TPA: hypothetical protein VFT22_07220 [Kofleriaceae bacterium]|nr:hypothetical protein [Kofleriaceae bacterium]
MSADAKWVWLEVSDRGPRIVIAIGVEELIVTPSSAARLRDELAAVLESLPPDTGGGAEVSFTRSELYGR